MELKHFLMDEYWEIPRDKRIYLLKCGNEACGAIVNRLASEGVKPRSQCPKCTRFLLQQIDPDKLSQAEMRSCLVNPALLSTKDLAPLAKTFTLKEMSAGVVAWYVPLAAAELKHRASLLTAGHSSKAKYNDYIKPPGENDIWLARAVFAALRIEGSLNKSGPMSSGSMGVCTRSDGSAELGFSGDASKASVYAPLMKSFFELYKNLYPELRLALAMEENGKLIDKYYKSFKTMKKGEAVQSTWERHCAESKFLNLDTVKWQRMMSCTVLWIGANSMNVDFCLFKGRDTVGAPMLPCGHCQVLDKFLSEL